MDPGPSHLTPLDAVAQAVLALPAIHPSRIAVDGRTASGKTTFADALASRLERSGRQIIRASIDGFHHPKAVRYRKGRLSSDGYYEDARDFAAVRRLLLDPLGPEGDRRYAAEAFDLDRDEPLKIRFHRAREDAVLILDGTFLQRPELRSAWDLVIFLDLPEEEARRRGSKRDMSALGGLAQASEMYKRRYEPAFRRYEAECEPMAKANFVIDNREN